MTPDERQLIQGLFDRMRQNGPADKDRDAESFINQAARHTPDAIYLLVQSVLAQEHYLQESANRIQDLETQVRDLEDDLARTQQPQKSGGGSFLGGLFGGAKPEQQPTQRGSVPSFGAGRTSPPPGQPGSPWGAPAQRGGWSGQPQGGFAQPVAQPPAQQSGAPSFMRSALTTAAGVAGGMMAANAIQGMLGGHHGSANAAGAASSGSSPYEIDNAADRAQAAENAYQDGQQDQEIAAEETAFDDSNSDWSSDDDTEV